MLKGDTRSGFKLEISLDLAQNIVDGLYKYIKKAKNYTSPETCGPAKIIWRAHAARPVLI